MYNYRIGSVFITIECLNRDDSIWLMSIMNVPMITDEEYELNPLIDPDWVLLASSEESYKNMSRAQHLNKLKKEARLKMSSINEKKFLK